MMPEWVHDAAPPGRTNRRAIRLADPLSAAEQRWRSDAERDLELGAWERPGPHFQPQQ